MGYPFLQHIFSIVNVEKVYFVSRVNTSGSNIILWDMNFSIKVDRVNIKAAIKGSNNRTTTTRNIDGR
jgi:hypothetical protein